MIASCYFTAPAARAVVAWVVFGLGAVYALWIAVVSWAWLEFFAAGAWERSSSVAADAGPKDLQKKQS